MQLATRDIDIIEGVHTFRVLSQGQIQNLYFSPRNKSGAQRRLEKLFDHKFLERRFLPVTEGRSPTLYVLDRKGAELLRAERGYDELVWYRSSKTLRPDFLAHTLAINEVMVAITLACREQGHLLETWYGENQIKADYDRTSIYTPAGKRQQVPIVPDSYFTIVANQRRYPLLLELDRGTMTVSRFQTKVLGYIAYYRSGEYERRYGVKSIRVLTVTLSEQRLKNLKKATEAVGGLEWFWFGVLSELTSDVILSAPVWWQATHEERKSLIRSAQDNG